ncbi:transcription elongation factor S-II [Pancytospora philotis]|nr:transcription elongation factor S-II [Pancytospora philotis]
MGRNTESAIKNSDISQHSASAAESAAADAATKPSVSNKPSAGRKPDSKAACTAKSAGDAHRTSNALDGKESGDEREVLTEKQALDKYATKSANVDKAAAMFLGAFKANIESIDFAAAAPKCFQIARCIMDIHGAEFSKTVRSKCYNLKENAELCADIYNGAVEPLGFVKMSHSEMKSEKTKKLDASAYQKSVSDAQTAQVSAETDLFQCSRCKNRKCVYSQQQTRSCDEPMTTFVYCTVCENRWKF